MSAALLMLAAAVLAAPGALRARARMSPHRLPAPFDREDTEKGLLGMAFSLDMFGVCLRSGMPVAAAALVVAAAAPVELARILHRAGEMLALGAPASTAWMDTGSPNDPGYEQRQALTRLARRSADSGGGCAFCHLSSAWASCLSSWAWRAMCSTAVCCDLRRGRRPTREGIH
ncbi:Flp pilus assembly protein TadC [Mycobacteroides abscessus subsp. abscessus]|nr:Flp pilus assembly protein TadC [Mycobacteroides abscessus subsp. abscessus]